MQSKLWPDQEASCIETNDNVGRFSVQILLEGEKKCVYEVSVEVDIGE
jgi:hypothetical protein